MKRSRSATVILALSLLGLEGCQTKSPSRDNDTAAVTVKPKTAPIPPDMKEMPTPTDELTTPLVHQDEPTIPPAHHDEPTTPPAHPQDHDPAHHDEPTTPPAHHHEAITEHSTPAIYIFSCGVPTNGSLGGRSGADELCVNHKPAACKAEAQVHALLTVSKDDRISMDKFAKLAKKNQVPTALPVVFIKDTTIIPLTDKWGTFLKTRAHKKISKVKGKEVAGLEELVEGAILVGDTTIAGTKSCSGWTSSKPQDKAIVGWNRHKKDKDFKELESSCSTNLVTENEHDKGQAKHLMGVCW